MIDQNVETQPNAEDTNQIDVSDGIVRKRIDQESLDLAKILSIPEGRRFITRILQMTGINQLSDADPVQCQRSEGARSVGILLCDILNAHSIHAYPLLLTEAARDLMEEKRQYEHALEARKREKEAAERRGIMPWLRNIVGLERAE